MPGFLQNLEQVRAINWGKEYLWDIRFPDAPSPFSNWYPATDLELNPFTAASFVYNAYMRDYKFPQSKSSPDLSLTYLDSVDKTLYMWLKDWFNDIYDEERGLLTVAEAVRPVDIAYLDYKRNPFKVETYLVYPDGGHPFKGTSNEASVPSYNISMVIAGKR